MELEFRVPFLHLPVKRAMDTMHTMGWGGDLSKIPSANLNLAALGLGGAVIIGSAVAVPILTALFSKKQGGKPYYGENPHKSKFITELLRLDFDFILGNILYRSALEQSTQIIFRYQSLLSNHFFLLCFTDIKNRSNIFFYISK